MRRCGCLVVVRIVPGPDYTDEDRVSVVAEMKARMGSEMALSIERVDSIERITGGKFRAVVNHSGRNGTGVDVQRSLGDRV